MQYIKFVRRKIGEIVSHSYDIKKISAPSQTGATVQITPKICQGQPPTFGSHCSRCHPNRFTFGGVIAERVNTVLLPVEFFQYSLRVNKKLIASAGNDMGYITMIRKDYSY